MNKIIATAAIALCLLFSGCATLMGDDMQSILISSEPGGADIRITDEAGAEVFRGKTPTNANLEKSDGTYWGGKNYIVKILKDGFIEQTIPVSSRPNGWYIGGNLLFGGIIGYFIVDPLSGKMYTLSPEKVSPSRRRRVTHNNRASDGSISIVLLQEVPPSLRNEMKELN